MMDRMYMREASGHGVDVNSEQSTKETIALAKLTTSAYPASKNFY